MWDFTEPIAVCKVIVNLINELTSLSKETSHLNDFLWRSQYDL